MQQITGRAIERALPVVVCLQLFAQQNRCVTDTLLDHPRAFHHAGYELEDGVPPGIGRCIIASQKSE